MFKVVCVCAGVHSRVCMREHVRACVCVFYGCVSARACVCARAVPRTPPVLRAIITAILRKKATHESG